MREELSGFRLFSTNGLRKEKIFQGRRAYCAHSYTGSVNITPAPASVSPPIITNTTAPPPLPSSSEPLPPSLLQPLSPPPPPPRPPLPGTSWKRRQNKSPKKEGLLGNAVFWIFHSYLICKLTIAVVTHTRSSQSKFWYRQEE